MSIFIGFSESEKNVYNFSDDEIRELYFNAKKQQDLKTKSIFNKNFHFIKKSKNLQERRKCVMDSCVNVINEHFENMLEEYVYDFEIVNELNEK